MAAIEVLQDYFIHPDIEMSLDYLNYGKRMESFIQNNPEITQEICADVSVLNDAKILQLIFCQLNKDSLDVSQQYPLSDLENQPYLEALSFLYGWNAKPKNPLRAASLFKKIIDSGREQHNETIYLCYALIALCYLQQTADREIYLREACTALDHAHNHLDLTDLPYRREIITTLIDLLPEFNEELIPIYLQTLLNFYSSEMLRVDKINMDKLGNAMLVLSDYMQPYLSSITATFIDFYQHQTNPTARECIIDLLHQLKEKLAHDPEQTAILDHALAECEHLATQIHEPEIVAEEETPAEEIVYHEPPPTPSLDAMLQADEALEKGDIETALNLYAEVYYQFNSIDALSQMASIQSDHADQYQQAIENYHLLGQHPDAIYQFPLLHKALSDLKKMYDDLPEIHPKRNSIAEVIHELLNVALSNDIPQISSQAMLTEFEEFFRIAQIDPSILNPLKESLSAKEMEEQQEDNLRYIQKLIDSTKNSSKRQLETLISLLNSEKNNRNAMAIIQHAVNQWLESMVRVDKDHVFIKDLNGIIELAKQGKLAAQYYLARHLAQENKFQATLSLSARIILSANEDNFSEPIKNHARNFIEQSANTPIEKGFTRYFSKQDELILYAKDLLEIVKSPPISPDPDVTIETYLMEKSEGNNSSYNKYILDISSLGLKSEIAPLRAGERRKK